MINYKKLVQFAVNKNYLKIRYITHFKYMLCKIN